MTGIRVDGNNQIGLGHIMRCLTIAKALKKQGEDVLFILADETCCGLIEGNGFARCVLNSDYSDLEKETDELLSVLKKHKINRLLLDTYFVTPYYLETLREELVTFYIDDVGAFDYPVNMLINYNIFAKQGHYPYTCGPTDEHAYAGARTVLLAGAAYAPVRDEFKEYAKDTRREVKDIFLSLGGSDAYNLSCKIIRRILPFGKWNIHVVCGPFNGFKDELRALAEENSCIFVYENVKEMWKLMSQCDMAVSAAGSTMYELSVSGLPVITFSFVENQRKIAEGFADREAAVSAGHYCPAGETEFLDRLEGLIGELAEDYDLRRKLAGNASAGIDGKGASRIAKAILEYKR